LLEEYGPEIVYIKGIHNTVADAISRLEYDPSINRTASSDIVQKQNWMTVSKHWCNLEKDDTTEHEDQMNLVFANHGKEEEIYPLTTIEIAESQKKDRKLKTYFKNDDISSKKDISLQIIDDTQVLCKNDKLIIPASLQHRAVSWYHHYLQHPGHSRLEETIRSVMYWKGMRHTIRSYVKSCRSCQINKRHSQKYGHVPPKLVITTPWKALCVDLIGPYTLTGKDGSSIDFMCLTMIDPATSWFEIVVDKSTFPTSGKGKKVTYDNNYTKDADMTFDKSSAQISNLVYKTWFSRYPRCRYIIYDNGSEFKLHFRALCDSYGIKRKPTSVKNPQANAILERIHAVIMNMLRTSEINMADSVKTSDIDVFLTDAAWAIRSTYHTVLKASPGAAIFGRDMLFDIPFIADWKKIGEHRQLLTVCNTSRENEGRIDYDYKVGQKVLIRKEGILRKTESRHLKDPWVITSVHTNGTIRVQCRNKSERINIRRVKPFHE
jgi:hypothetical protein